MREFLKGNGWVQWNKGDKAIIVFESERFVTRCPKDCGYDATREEFIAAAMQAIEKMREAGIDIGTDWLPKWEPKKGEVCWFFSEGFNTLFLSRFKEISKPTSSYLYPYVCHDGGAFQHCAPFDGTIPEPFKSRWEAEKP